MIDLNIALHHVIILMIYMLHQVLICNDPNCQLSSHESDIDYFYTQICDALDKASKYCIPSSRKNYYKDHIVI